MKQPTVLLAFVLLLSAFAFGQTQDRDARRLAARMSAAFFNGLGVLDKQHLVRGRLLVSQQYDIYDIGQHEFDSRSFHSFTAMERWMKSEEHEDGTPFRMSGEKLYCRRGLCRLDLVDNQMAHNHVYLTRIWYARSGGKLYVKKVRILYG
jgi:hypothetical protein